MRPNRRPDKLPYKHIKPVEDKQEQERDAEKTTLADYRWGNSLRHR